MSNKQNSDRYWLGVIIRRRIRETKVRTGRSLRHMSLAVGQDGNYLSSYLRVPVKKWSIPKHPTYGKLLSELGITEKQVLADARAARLARDEAHEQSEPVSPDN